MQIITNQLVLAIEALSTHFMPNELAFLGATSPVELPFRDKLAFQLYSSLGQEFLVVRDWQKDQLPTSTTVAILNKLGQPAALIDLRSAAHPGGLPGSTATMMVELAKLKQLAPPATQLYHIFIQHLPAMKLENPMFSFMPGLATFAPWVEYYKQVASTFDNLQRQAIQQWEQFTISTLGIDETKLTTRLVEGGVYYLTAFRFLVFLCGPFTPEDPIFQLNNWKSVD